MVSRTDSKSQHFFETADERFETSYEYCLLSGIYVPQYQVDNIRERDQPEASCHQTSLG